MDNRPVVGNEAFCERVDVGAEEHAISQPTDDNGVSM